LRGEPTFSEKKRRLDKGGGLSPRPRIGGLRRISANLGEKKAFVHLGKNEVTDVHLRKLQSEKKCSGK